MIGEGATSVGVNFITGQEYLQLEGTTMKQELRGRRGQAWHFPLKNQMFSGRFSKSSSGIDEHIYFCIYYGGADCNECHLYAQ